jgi:hypothetical protein
VDEQSGNKKYLIGGAVLVLALLASFGARERSWIKEVSEVRKSLETEREISASLKTEKSTLETALKKTERRVKKRVPVQMPDGSIAYAEEEIAETFEEATSSLKRDFEAKLATERQRSASLEATLKSKEIEVVRSAPRWALLTGFDLLAPTRLDRARVGGGMNFGPLTAGLTLAPGGFVGADFSKLPALGDALRPLVEVDLRF